MAAPNMRICLLLVLSSCQAESYLFWKTLHTTTLSSSEILSLYCRGQVFHWMVPDGLILMALSSLSTS